jgi:tRNA 2-thiouridine synthesizing protein E
MNQTPTHCLDAGTWEKAISRSRDWNGIGPNQAREANIQLNDDHWDVIRFAVTSRNRVARCRFVIKHLAGRMGREAQKSCSSCFPTAT